MHLIWWFWLILTYFPIFKDSWFQVTKTVDTTHLSFYTALVYSTYDYRSNLVIMRNNVFVLKTPIYTSQLDSDLSIFYWFKDINLFTLLSRSASFSHKKTRSYPGRIQWYCVFNSDKASTHFMQHFHRICKNKARTILWNPPRKISMILNLKQSNI